MPSELALRESRPGAQVPGTVGVLLSGRISHRGGLVWGRRFCVEVVGRGPVYAGIGKGDLITRLGPNSRLGD